MVPKVMLNALFKYFQYIIGNWDFLDLTLKLRPPVFIPRPETEKLVGLVIEQLKVS